MTLTDDLDLLVDSDFRLRLTYPNMVPAKAKLAFVAAELVEQYTDYVNDVSEAEHAASLETSAYLLFLCRVLKAARVLDLGSGFSSYVLRHYATNAGYPVTVVSVDTDPVWADRTIGFCDSQGVGCWVESWPDFAEDTHEPFNVIFHDLAGGLLRTQAMAHACSLVAPGGVVVFDDSHHDGHRAGALAACSDSGLEWFSLHRQTSDRFNRFASLGVRA